MPVRLARTTAGLLAAAIAAVAVPASAQDCAALAGVTLPHAKISSATMVGTDGFAEPVREGRPVVRYAAARDFCRVRGVSSPVAGSKIGFEVWLPASATWSARLHMVGNGGYGSNLYYAQMAARVARGDVAVATDTGHSGGDLGFGRDNPVAIADWGNRAVHESVVAAKLILKAYYGKPQRFAYFSGSSTGGHQALMVAQRHPEDFDGIIAGAPGNNRTNLNLLFLWEFLQNHRRGDNEHPIVPDAKLKTITAAAIKACDAGDGVADGVINDPRECRFDVATMLCPAAETSECLTAEQVATIKAIYQGPRDARTGKQLYPGLTFGSEGIDYDDHAGWNAFWANPDKPNEPNRADFFRYWVFHDVNWDWWRFDWGKDVDTVLAAMAPVINATDPDLSRFRAHGGKLILFMGWNDPVGSAPEAIDYYHSVVARSTGADAAAKLADTQGFARLYMIAGMSHTATGPGATYVSNATRDSAPPVEDSRHDMARALQDWVEKGVAPNDLVATHFAKGSGPAGTIGFQRPICVYPKIPRYRSGDKASAASFRCTAPGQK
jgi:feruloyl esterase